MPQRRICSIVLTLVVLARGRRCETRVRGSMTTHSMPCKLSSAAAARPAGPPPTTSTGVLTGHIGSLMPGIVGQSTGSG